MIVAVSFERGDGYFLHGIGGIDRGLERQPLLAFCLCYVTAHLALDLVDEKQAEAILNYCEEHLEELETNK